MSEQVNVQVAIALVAAAVGAVGKNAKMEAGPARYKYRSLDDLVDAVHGPLTDHGVTFTPHAIELLDTLERTTKSGAVQYHLRAFVTYRVYGPAGDFIEACVLAEGTDTGDKAGNKLMSGAYKYALSQVLSLPYTMEDQDATLSEPVQTERATPQNAGILSELNIAAEALGQDITTITNKFRTEQGGLTMEEFNQLSPERLRPFVRQVVRYAAKQGKEA